MKLNIPVAVISMFLCLNAAFCEEPVVKTEIDTAVPFSSGKNSIGVNGLPWMANYIALRGWDKNKSGSELIISATNLLHPRDSNIPGLTETNFLRLAMHFFTAGWDLVPVSLMKKPNIPSMAIFIYTDIFLWV